MKLPVMPLAVAALAGLAACSEQKSVANQFEETGNAIRGTANAIESDTERAVDAAENALDQEVREWENKSIEVNVSVANRQ